MSRNITSFSHLPLRRWVLERGGIRDTPWFTYIPNKVVEGPFHTSALQMQSQEISKPFSLMLTCCAQLSAVPM